MPIVRPGKIDIERARRETDWTRIDGLTDEQLTANALSDPDNPPLAEGEFAALPVAIDVGAIRRQLKMSQRVFAKTFGIPLRTLQDWEQGRRGPDQTVRAYLRVIARDPDAVRRALAA